MIDGWGFSCEIALIWMSLDKNYEKSTLVQVMAWCGQAEAITSANVDPDLCRHMASLGHNELMSTKYMYMYSATMKSTKYLLKPQHIRIGYVTLVVITT